MKFKKVMIATCLTVTTIASTSLNCFAIDLAGHIPGNAGRGNGRYTSTYTQSGMQINITTTRTDGKSFTGTANDGHSANPKCIGQTASAAVLAAGVSAEAMAAYMAKYGITEVNGNWKIGKQIVNVIDLSELLGLPIIPDDPPPRADPGENWKKVEQTSQGQWVITNINMNATYNRWDTSPKDEKWVWAMDGFTDDSESSGDSPHSSDPKTLYYTSCGGTHGASIELPLALNAECEATFTWMKGIKHWYNYYHWEHVCDTCYEVDDHDSEGNKTGSHMEHSSHMEWVYKYSANYWYTADSTTQTAENSEECDIMIPTYYVRQPIDLKTLENYTGAIKVTDLGSDLIINFGDSAPASEKLGFKIIEKNTQTSGIAGQNFKVVANNTPSTFTIDWNDTYFGIKINEKDYPAYNEHSGEGNPGETNWIRKGYNNIVGGYMFYGSDMEDVKKQEVGAPSVSSLNDLTDSTGDNEILDSILTARDSKMNFKSKFYLRNIQPADPGKHYNLGTAENNVWICVFEKKVDNLRGINFQAVASCPSPGSGVVNVTAREYNKYFIYDYFIQPVLYGEYEPVNAAGNN